MFGGFKKVADKTNALMRGVPAEQRPQAAPTPQSALNSTVTSMFAPEIAQAWNNVNQATQQVAANTQQQQQAPQQAATAPAASQSALAGTGAYAPQYTNNAITYGADASKAATGQAVRGTGAYANSQRYAQAGGTNAPYDAASASYQRMLNADPITSRFAGARQYTKANAQRAGDVLQQLYTGSRPQGSTAGEQRLMGGIAAQGGASFGEAQEKAMREQADKAWAQTDPNAIADRLVAAMPGVAQGTNLEQLVGSWVGPAVQDADMLERQARVNEALRTGQQGALGAEDRMSFRNKDFREDLGNYGRDTAKEAVAAAKANVAGQVAAAEGNVAAAREGATNAGTSAEYIAAVNEVERMLGKDLTTGKVTPQTASALSAEAQKELERRKRELAEWDRKYGYNLKLGGVTARQYQRQRDKLAADVAAAERSLTNLRQYSGAATGSSVQARQAQSELEKLQSVYGRF